jgi:hypothetical protein
MEDYLYQNNLFLPLGGVEKKLTAKEIARSFLYYYPANEGIQPTTNML